MLSRDRASGSIEEAVRWLWGFDDARQDKAVPAIGAAALVEELLLRLETAPEAEGDESAFWRDAAMVCLVGWGSSADLFDAAGARGVESDESDRWSSLPSTEDLLRRLLECRAGTAPLFMARYAMLLFELATCVPDTAAAAGVEVEELEQELERAVHDAHARGDYAEAALLLRAFFLAPEANESWLEDAIPELRRFLAEGPMNDNRRGAGSAARAALSAEHVDWPLNARRAQAALEAIALAASSVALPKAASPGAYQGLEISDPRSDAAIQVRETLDGGLIVEVFGRDGKELSLPLEEFLSGASAGHRGGKV